MEERNDSAAVKKIATDINDVKDKAFMSKACYKAQLNTFQDILKERKTAYLQCKIQSEANKNLNESVQNSLKVFNHLLIVESTKKKAISELTNNFHFTKKCATDTLRQKEINFKSHYDRYVQTKARRERLPSVQTFLQIENTKKEILCDLQSRNERIDSLKKSFTAKTILIRKADHERILKLVQFMIHERSEILVSIKAIMADIDRLNNMINRKKEKSVSHSVTNCDPKLKLQSISKMQETGTKDLEWPYGAIFRKQINDEISDSSINILKIDVVEPKLISNLVLNSVTNIVKYTDPENDTFTNDKWNTEYFASQYLLHKKNNNTLNNSGGNEKQIRLIDDKNVNEEEAQSMLFSVNPNTLKSVTVIDSNSLKTSSNEQNYESYQYMDIDSTYKPMEITEMIEPVDEQFITPPTQFRDQIITEEKTSEQEKTTHNEPLDSDPKAIFKKSHKRKRVAFDVPEDIETDHVVQETVVSPGGDNINDMTRTDLVKKYKLDSSPQFNYAKNNLQKRNDDKLIKSKFFSVSDSLPEGITEEGKTIQNEPMSDRRFAGNSKNVSIEKKDDALFRMELHNPVKQTKASLNLDVQPIVSCSKDVPSSFDSIFSTAITDDDHEYQTSIDTSLLLSPKSDMPEDDDKHNFLSGIKEKGLPFFGNVCSETITNPDQNFENKESFSFNFGKNKTKSGFFNMFH